MSASNVQRLGVGGGASPADQDEGVRSRMSSNSGLPFGGSPPSNSANSAASTRIRPSKVLFTQLRIQHFLNHWLWTLWVTLIILFALFGDDMKLLTTEKTADPTFDVLSLIAIGVFTVELVLLSYSQEGYFLSFFFWLDVISTVSIFADVTFIWDSLVSTGQGNQAAKTTQLARAGRASRAGTKASRILRSIRVIRLLRIMKLNRLAQTRLAKQQEFHLYRHCVNFRGYEEPVRPFNLDVPGELKEWDDAESVDSFSFVEPVEPKSSMLENRLVSEGPSALLAHLNNVKTPVHSKQSDVDEDLVQARSSSPDGLESRTKVPEESKVGKRLSDLTTKRVVILVLGMMFGLPLFTLSLYYEENNSFTFGLEMIAKFRGSDTEYTLCWNRYISEHSDIDTPLILVEVDSVQQWAQGVSEKDLRDEEQYIVSVSDNGEFLSVFDYRKRNKVQAGLNIARTIFVCIVLAISSLLFSKGANDLVLGPIENMIKRVKKISINPLEAAQDEEREAVERERLMMENPKLLPKQSKKGGPMETEVLEQTIIKIGALLALGFGEAGTEVIATNMKKGGGEVDPMIPGKKTHCIFGFCDIRNFTDATEVLQEGVMVFVNEIAEIVHSIVYLYSGSANKNIGDAFLLVWKFPYHIKWGENHKPTSFVRQLSDMSLISFLKIIAEINKNPKILKYRKNEELKRRMPNYCVRMGFGLHVGWAIEGAIGSEFKVDASYLSPHVNTASRLEAATKVYNVPLLVSGKLTELFSKETKARLRQIDRVTIKGSKDPLSLYTCDVNPMVLPPAPMVEQEADQDMKVRKVKMRLERDKLKKDVMKNAVEMWRAFDEDRDLKLMREGISEEFIQAFKSAFLLYVQGRWDEAKVGLLYSEQLKGDKDGPVQSLVEFIDEHGGVAPISWMGYRELIEK